MCDVCNQYAPTHSHTHRLRFELECALDVQLLIPLHLVHQLAQASGVRLLGKWVRMHACVLGAAAREDTSRT